MNVYNHHLFLAKMTPLDEFFYLAKSCQLQSTRSYARCKKSIANCVLLKKIKINNNK